jgi:hypothetical protein
MQLYNRTENVFFMGYLEVISVINQISSRLMKKIFFFIFLVLGLTCAQAQRFFYVDGNPITEKIMKGALQSASQQICVSPLSSDYIVKTDIGFQSGENVLTLQINLQDSVTFQTIFQRKEIYRFGVFHSDSQLLLRTVILAFIERNITQIVLSAYQQHAYGQISGLRARKDKT